MMKIIVINPFGIGDVIFSTPLLEILKRNFPDSFIGYVCNRRVSELMEQDPHINRVYVYEKDDYRDMWRRSRIECFKRIWGLLKSIRAERFDISIDLSLTYHYTMLLFFLGVKERVGFNYRSRGKFLTKKMDIEGFSNRHVIEYYLDLLRLLAIDPAVYKAEPHVYIGDSEITWSSNFLAENGIADTDLIIGVIPGCGASWGPDARFRRWEREKFAAVADIVIERYKAKVLLFGEAKESEICDAVKAMMKNTPIMTCGRTSLKQFLGLLKRCRLVITNDGGPLHMAVALGVDTISIFGPVDERVYGPYPSNPKHTVISKKDLSCRPCYRKFKYDVCDDRPCLREVSPDSVLAAVEQALSR